MQSSPVRERIEGEGPYTARASRAIQDSASPFSPRLSPFPRGKGLGSACKGFAHLTPSCTRSQTLHKKCGIWRDQAGWEWDRGQERTTPDQGGRCHDIIWVLLSRVLDAWQSVVDVFLGQQPPYTHRLSIGGR